MTYDDWKLATPPELDEPVEDEIDDDACIRDDSTECDCSRCTGAEDRFWRDQGEGLDDEPVTEPDGYEDRT